MQDHHEIRVRPYGEGWAVECDAVCQPIVFLTRARAEVHGRTMAVAMAQAGYDVRMLICDQEGAVIAAGRYFAVEPDGVWLSLA